MKSGRFARRLALVAGGGAIIAMGALTAGCGDNGTTSPSSTTTTTTVSPTEKNITPGGPNSFSPSVKAPAAPIPLPGDQRHTGPAN